MFEFRLNCTVEVTQTGNALAIQTPVPLQLHYRGGRWDAECESPSISTPKYDRWDEALVAGARAVSNELQMAVNERPIAFARITPDDVPRGRF